MNLTNQQLDIINFERGNILVSASAGTGKTKVMIDRIIKLILDKRAGVNDILAVTFTSAAAEELRQKLSGALIKELNKTEDTEAKNYLYSQLLAVPSSQVSTLHSFCANLIKSYFYALGLDAECKVADEKENAVLRNRALNGLFNELYEAADKDFLFLFEIFARKRGDGLLKQIILNIYFNIISKAEPLKEFEKSLNFLNENGYKECENDYLRVINGRIDYYISRTERYFVEFSNWDMPAFCDYSVYFKSALRDIRDENNIYYKAKKINEHFPPLPLVRTEKLSENRFKLKEEFKDFKGAALKELEGLVKGLPSSFEEGLSEALHCESYAKLIFELTQKFIDRYGEIKRNENVLDFNDLEHFTIKLLRDGKIREETAGKYKYIFIDEYQDINGVQEEILSLISSGNTFMVGDAKQSIYAFRGCDSRIFTDKFDRFLNGEGAARYLSYNFRSADNVLKSVNNVFSKLMTKENTSIDYQSGALSPGGLYEKDTGKTVLHVYEDKGEAALPPLTGVYEITGGKACEAEDFTEGKIAAEIITEKLSEKFYDIKTNEYRNYTYGDMAVLVRSFSENAQKIAETLVKHDIPVCSSIGGNILDKPEIKFLINVLEYLDNSKQDYPLIACLKRIGGLTVAELSEIGRREGSFFYEKYEAALVCRGQRAVDSFVVGRDDHGALLADKLKAFDTYIREKRENADFLSAFEILSQIIREKNLDLFFLSEKNGRVKLDNIRRFLAESVVNGKKLTVRQFLERINEGESEITQSSGGENSVKIITMHMSKGLEFPLVIIPLTAQKFNLSDVREEVLYDKKYGFLFKFYDLNNMVRKQTLFRLYAKENIVQEQIKEEMRIFYVAQTRARHDLHLIAGSGVLNGFQDSFSAYKSYEDFLDFNDFGIETYKDELKEFEKKQNVINLGACDEALKNSIKENLLKETNLKRINYPVKASVTQINLEEKYNVQYVFEGESESIEAGNAYHKFLQLIDFKDNNAKALNNLKEQFVKDNILTQNEADLIDVNIISRALSLEIFSPAGAVNNCKVYKEKKFMMYFDASLNAGCEARGVNGVAEDAAFGVPASAEGTEKTLIQGVFDLLVLFPDKALIIDYKCTNIKDDHILKEKYFKQLKLYSLAAEKLFNLKAEGYIVTLGNNVRKIRIV